MKFYNCLLQGFKILRVISFSMYTVKQSFIYWSKNKKQTISLFDIFFLIHCNILIAIIKYYFYNSLINKFTIL